MRILRNKYSETVDLAIDDSNSCEIKLIFLNENNSHYIYYHGFITMVTSNAY